MGQKACDMTCTDQMSDPSHCGGCTNVCPVGQVCSRGACSPPPTPTVHLCPAGQCADYPVKGSCYENSSVANDCIDFVGSAFTPESVKAICVVNSAAPADATVTFSSAPCKSGSAYRCCLTGTTPGMEILYCPYTLAIGASGLDSPLCDADKWIAN